MSKDKIIQPIVILVLLAIFGAAGFFIYRAVNESNPLLSKEGAGGGQTSPQPSPSKGEGEGQEQVYTHPDYGFTLRYPGNLKLGKFPEGEGEIILFQGQNTPLTKGVGGIEGFQIFISPYNETEEFSKEVILKADPKMKIENDKNIKIGGIVSSEEGTDPSASSGQVKVTTSPIPALSFDSSNDQTPTHEVWFVADGNLYQATSFQQYGGEMERIIKTIRFN